MDNTNETLDNFDRAISALQGLPETLATKVSTVQDVAMMYGKAALFSVQTYRQKERGDTIFLQCVRDGQTIRIAIPPQVADAIARQRDALTARSRSAAAKTQAQARKERGELPGFMRSRFVGDPKKKQVGA